MIALQKVQLITSSPDDTRDESWSAFDVLNIVNLGERGDIKVSPAVDRIFHGRFGPPLSAVMEAVTGPTILINADIKISLTPEKIMQILETHEFAISQRIETPSGKINPWGIDMFIMDRRFIQRIMRTTGWEMLQLGAPWWDYVLPIAASMTGASMGVINAPVAFHETHTQRWDKADHHVTEYFAKSYFQRLGFAPAGSGSFGGMCFAEIMSRADPINLRGTLAENVLWEVATDALKPITPEPIAITEKRVSFGRGLERACRPYVKRALRAVAPLSFR